LLSHSPVAGADWVDQAAVVDGNLICARTPADLGPWMKALRPALASSSEPRDSGGRKY
jgi:putative intracellular protease/amidase